MNVVLLLHTSKKSLRFPLLRVCINSLVFSLPLLHCFQFCSSEVISPQQQAHNKQIAYWLFGMSGLVAGMVTVGGVTRLAKSGLSMADWKLQVGTVCDVNAV